MKTPLEDLIDATMQEHERRLRLRERDINAVREPLAGATLEDIARRKNPGRHDGMTRFGKAEGLGAGPRFHGLGKNPGDVVTLATQPTPYAHFATFPLDLVLRFLPALCPPRVCAACGEPLEHRVEKTGNPAGICGGEHREPERAGGLANGRPRDYEAEKRIGELRDLGYFPACDCGTEAGTVPGTVLDPFLGSGTTTQAARKLGRRSIGIELNRAYEQVMRQRLGCPKGALISDVEFESGEATT